VASCFEPWVQNGYSISASTTAGGGRRRALNGSQTRFHSEKEAICRWTQENSIPINVLLDRTQRSRTSYTSPRVSIIIIRAPCLVGTKKSFIASSEIGGETGASPIPVSAVYHADWLHHGWIHRGISPCVSTAKYGNSHTSVVIAIVQSVYLSVSPSRCGIISTKTCHTLTRFAPNGSPKTLVFGDVTM